MKCHQINDKTERNHEKQTFQDFQKKKFIMTMARPPSQADEKLTTQQETTGMVFFKYVECVLSPVEGSAFRDSERNWDLIAIRD